LPQADRFSTRVFGLAVVAILVYLLFHIFEPFFGPIYWAFLLAFMLFPVNRRLRQLVKGRKGLAAGLLTLGVLLGIAVPAAVGMVAFARQAIELGGRLSAAAQRYQIGGVEDILKLPVLGGAIEWLHGRFRLDTAQVQAWVVQGAQDAVQFLLSRSRDVLFGALGIFGSLTLTLFILFFFFRDGDAMAARVRTLIPLDPKRKERLDSHLQGVTRAVVFGTVVTALAQGALLGVGFWITGVPSPLVFGVMAAVASFIPFVGTGLVWVPAAIYLYAQGVAWKTIFLVVWSAVVVGSADNVLRPMLVSGKGEIGTLTVFLGVLGGLAAFGFIGLFLGPVILALALTLLDFAGEEAEKNAPAS
jgi:predicted PurR-regulated permease PerM